MIGFVNSENKEFLKEGGGTMHNNSMADIIYDYFTSRIVFGYYLLGDQLPSISYICRQFQVSALTVRTALIRMREEGYIETTERKRSIVTFRPDEQQEQRYRNTFLSRREGMNDMCRNSDILFRPIVHYYLQRQTEDSIKQIRSQLKKRKGHPAKQINMFYAEAMRPLNNSLVLNLHWEMVRYLQPPYLQRPANFEDSDTAAEHIEQMLSLIEAGNIEKALEMTQAFSKNVTQMFFESLGVMLDTPEPVKQIPFEWQIYREHPQMCYTLAAELMSKIDARIYKQEELLPPCQVLAQKYDVSLITMRRTLELLNDIHVTETQNGVGTRVISGRLSGPPDLSHLQIRKCLLMLLQAMQMSALTCKNVAVHTLSSLDDEDFQALEREIECLTEEGTPFLAAKACLRFIGENSSSAFIREVYRQLYLLLQWGHALHMFSQKLDAGRFYEDYAESLREKLCRRDIDGFAENLSELMKKNVVGTRALLLELGFKEEQLV